MYFHDMPPGQLRDSRYLGLKVMNRCRLSLVDTTDTEQENNTATLGALSA